MTIYILFIIFKSNILYTFSCFIFMATYKTWTPILDPDPEKPRPRKSWSLKNLDPDKPGPRKTWIQKNLNPKKLGPWKTWTLKNMVPEIPGSWKTWNKYRIKKYVLLLGVMFYKDHAQCDLLFNSTVEWSFPYIQPFRTFFGVHVFQGPGFFGFKFFRVQVFLSPGPSFRSNPYLYISKFDLKSVNLEFLLFLKSPNKHCIQYLAIDFSL